MKNDNGIDFVLDLTGACLSCGAAPRTLDGIKKDLENDPEVWRVRFDSKLLDTFDELGREFILLMEMNLSDNAAGSQRKACQAPSNV